MTQHNPNDTAFVLIGGVSHTPIFFEALVSELKSRGFESHAFAYPTIGPDNKGTTLQDEYKAVQEAIAMFANNGKDVVLVGHSYGGWPASRAVKGWDKATRKKADKKHGVTELVFLCAFCIPDGADMKFYSFLPPWIDVRDGQEHGERKPNEASIPLLFNDLPPDQQKYWYEQLAWQRNVFHGDTIPDAPWHLKDLPKTYILTTNDAAAVLDFQLTALKGVIDESWSVKSLFSGHEAMVSHPKELAEVLLAPRY